jgi:transposase-like protein
MKRISYSSYRFPPEIIQQAIWLYLRFTLSLRDVEDLLSHQPTRRRERKMQGFKNRGSAQRFLSAHAVAYNTLNVQRHLTSASTHRGFRAAAMDTWRAAVA